MTTLGAASSFAILANNLDTSGSNIIQAGNLGYNTLDFGNEPTLNNGTRYSLGDAEYDNAKTDLTAFITFITTGTPRTTEANFTDNPFAPGFYDITNGIISNGTITLDGPGSYYFNVPTSNIDW